MASLRLRTARRDIHGVDTGVPSCAFRGSCDWVAVAGRGCWGSRRRERTTPLAP